MQAAAPPVASSAWSTGATTPPGIALLEDDGPRATCAPSARSHNLKERAPGSNGSTATTGLGTRAGRRTAASPRRTRIRSQAATRPKLLDRPQRDRRELPRADGEPRGRRAHVHRPRPTPRPSPHLIERYYEGDLVEAVRLAFNELEGHFAFVVIHHDHPASSSAPATRRRSSSGSAWARCSSPRTPLRSCARRASVQFPSDGEIVALTPGRRDLPGRRRQSSSSTSRRARLGRRGRGEGRLRDVHAEGDLRAARGCGARRSATGVPRHASSSRGSAWTSDEVKDLRRIVILVGAARRTTPASSVATSIEEWARVPVELDIASEWIYRNPVHQRATTLVIGISQSGETRDTIEAIKLARESGRSHGRDHEHDGLAGHA